MWELSGCNRFFYGNLYKTNSHKIQESPGIAVLGAYNALSLSLTLSSGEPALFPIIPLPFVQISSSRTCVQNSLPSRSSSLTLVSAFIYAPFCPFSLFISIKNISCTYQVLLIETQSKTLLVSWTRW